MANAVKIQGIVIDLIKHNDSHNIVTLYTRSHGRIAFLVPVGKSKQGKARNAILNLMSCVETEVRMRQGRELERMRQPEAKRLWPGIYFNPVKSAVLCFMAEFCNSLLRQSPPDPQLYDYILYSLETLEGLPLRKAANFHIAFLVQLLPLVGILPSATDHGDGKLFDMLSGEMVDPLMLTGARRRELLSERETEAVARLARINYRNMHRYRFSTEERYRILEGLVRYYSYHLPMRREMKTLSVLRDIFA